MQREYPKVPLVGVAAVVIRDDQILLIQRGREPSRGLWSIPGGQQHLGETIRQTARREVQEETSVEVQPGELLSVCDYIRRDAEGRVRYQYVVVDVRATYLRGEPCPSDDALDARWVPRRELDEYPMPGRVRRVIQHALEGPPGTVLMTESIGVWGE